MLSPIYPLTGRVDLAVRLDSRDQGRSRNLDLASALDDSLQGGADVSLSFAMSPNT